MHVLKLKKKYWYNIIPINYKNFKPQKALRKLKKKVFSANVIVLKIKNIFKLNRKLTFKNFIVIQLLILSYLFYILYSNLTPQWINSIVCWSLLNLNWNAKIPFLIKLPFLHMRSVMINFEDIPI